ncbi:MAG TPA: tetratricopeptide repeat protein, partial [Gemmatirosa sp.]
LAVSGALAAGARAARHAAIPPAAPSLVTARPPAIRTVAVMPFVNTGDRAADDYFSDGLTDELSHALARLPGLRIAGRTSSYTFKGRSVAAPQVGRALGVGALVTGTVRRAGDRLRVSTQLVSTTDGTVLWDSVTESRSRDVFAVQDEFTRAIVAALTPALGGRPAAASAAAVGRGTTDQEAYELYLKGRYYWLQRSTADVARSIAYFRQAIARDSLFARAHAGVAMAYSVLPVYLAGPTDATTVLTMASARRAVALDSTLADAQLALGTALDLQLQFPEALAHYRRALALDPSSVTGHHWLGFSLLNVGRTDEALVELRHATALDPLATSPAAAVATGLLFTRRFPEAAAAARRVLALDSTFWFANYTLGLAQAFGGRPDSAIRTLERGTRLNPAGPGHHAALVFAYAAAGRWADAERVRAQLHRLGGDPSGGTEAAFADLVFGDREPLVRLLTSDAGQRRYIAPGGVFGCDPLLDPLWADARFRAAMRSLGVGRCALARPWPLPARPGA